MGKTDDDFSGSRGEFPSLDSSSNPARQFDSFQKYWYLEPACTYKKTRPNPIFW